MGLWFVEIPTTISIPTTQVRRFLCLYVHTHWFLSTINLLFVLLLFVSEFDTLPGRSKASANASGNRGRPGSLATLEQDQAHDSSGHSTNSRLDESWIELWNVFWNILKWIACWDATLWERWEIPRKPNCNKNTKCQKDSRTTFALDWIETWPVVWFLRHSRQILLILPCSMSSSIPAGKAHVVLGVVGVVGGVDSVADEEEDSSVILAVCNWNRI